LREPDAAHQEQLFEHAHVAAGRLVVQAELTAEQREVGELRGVGGQHAQQARHQVEMDHLGHVAHVALEDAVDVLARPRSAPWRRRAGVHLGVSAGQYRVEQRGRAQLGFRSRQLAVECAAKELRLPFQNLGLRQRQQRDHFLG